MTYIRSQIPLQRRASQQSAPAVAAQAAAQTTSARGPSLSAGKALKAIGLGLLFAPATLAAPTRGGAGRGVGFLNNKLEGRASNDGVASLNIFNNCHYPVTFAQDAVNDGGWAQSTITDIGAGKSYVHDIGPDNVAQEGLAFTFNEVGFDPGPGNSMLFEGGMNGAWENMDFVDLSGVNGYSRPGMQIKSPGMEDMICDEPSILADCPPNRTVVVNGKTAACTKGDPVKEPGVRDDPNHPVAKLIAAKCPEIYSWSLDDQDGGTNNPVRAGNYEDYSITLCPKNQD